MMLPRIGFIRLLLLAILINVMTQAIHETGHLLVYQAYHRNPTWGFIGLVQLWNATPLNPTDWVAITAPTGETGWLHLDSLPASKTEKALAAAAGPLASLASVVVGLWIATRSRGGVLKHIGLMLALLVSFVMLLYYLRSPLRSLGDESEIAAQLGIAKAWVEIPLALGFALGLGVGLRWLATWQTRWRWLAAILLGSVPSGLLLMYADQWVRESVNSDNPFFQPVVGYSAPVLVVYLLTFSGVMLWGYKNNAGAAPLVKAA